MQPFLSIERALKNAFSKENFFFSSLTKATLWTICLAVVFSNQIQAQDEAGSATVDSNYLIVLDTESELQDKYQADISELAFESASDAETIFHQFNLPAVSLEIDWDNKVLIVNIIGDPIHENFTVADWNEYFSDMLQYIEK